MIILLNNFIGFNFFIDICHLGFYQGFYQIFMVIYKEISIKNENPYFHIMFSQSK